MDTLIRLKVNNVNRLKHIGLNFNIRQILRENEVLSFTADYLHYYNEQSVNYDNKWLDGKNNLLFEQPMHTSKITPINFGVMKMDYVRNFGKKGKLEMGVKAVVSQFNNNVGVETLLSNRWIATLNLRQNTN